MGGTVVRIEMFAPLRAYSRSVAIEYHFKVAGVGSMTVAGKVVEAGIGLLRNVRNLPRWMIWGAVLLMTLALAHPTSRKKIFEIASQLFQGGALLVEATFQVIMPIVEQHALAQEKAQLSLAQARAALPPPDVLRS